MTRRRFTLPSDQPTDRDTSRPHYDADRRLLTLHGHVVKRFRVPADNQELILRALEEENWPPHLDDPLPPKPEIDRKKRLLNALYKLNHHQESNLLFFEADGRSSGVRWKVIEGRSKRDRR